MERFGGIARIRCRIPGGNVRNRLPIVIGTVMTAVFTFALVFLPEVLPMGAIRSVAYDLTGNWWWGNPFRQLRVVGGILGSIVTGYLAKDRFGRHKWSVSLVTGIYAGGLGVVLAYLLYLVGVFGYALLAAENGLSVGTVFSLIFVPLLFAMPLLWAYLIGGALGGLIGNGLQKLFVSVIGLRSR